MHKQPWWCALLLGVLVVPMWLAPQVHAQVTGSYRAIRDDVTARDDAWGLFCGEPLPIAAAKVGALWASKTLATEGEWELQNDSNERVGTQTCLGYNPSLRPENRRQEGNLITVSCRSTRVTRGTEETEQKIKQLSSGNIEIRIRSSRYFRERGDDCRTTVERTLLLQPLQKAPTQNGAQNGDKQNGDKLSSEKLTEKGGDSQDQKNKNNQNNDDKNQNQDADTDDVCANVGPIHQLIVSPRTFDIKVGGAPFCVTAKAQDENGCVIPANQLQNLTWTVEPDRLVRITADQNSYKICLTATAVSNESAILVSVKTKNNGSSVEAHAAGRVLPKSATEAQKTLAQLAEESKNSKIQQIVGEITRGEIVIRPLDENLNPALAPLAVQTRREKIRAVEEKNAVVTAITTGFGTFTVVGLLGFLAYSAAERRKRLREALQEESGEPLEAAPVPVPKLGNALVCPTCQFQFDLGVEKCPHDQTPLVPLTTQARQTLFIPVLGGMRCPTCEARYPTKTRFCGHDGTALVPEFISPSAEQPIQDEK